VVAAGVLSYGFHDLQEAGILPGLSSLAFDVSSHVDEGSWYGALLKGVFNFSPQTTWLQAGVWTAYLVITMSVFLRGVRRPAPAATPAAPAPRDKQPT
jgi:high-affinity iron transporter